jgi:hypothetical protein
LIEQRPYHEHRKGDWPSQLCDVRDMVAFQSIDGDTVRIQKYNSDIGTIIGKNSDMVSVLRYDGNVVWMQGLNTDKGSVH